MRIGRSGKRSSTISRLHGGRSRNGSRHGRLKSVGANATLVGDDVEAFVRRLKAAVEGDVDVAGPDLAGSLTDLGLIDEYHLYFRPFVLGRGKPYFAGARPPLRLVATNAVGEDAVRLTFVTALIAEPAGAVHSARNAPGIARDSHRGRRALVTDAGPIRAEAIQFCRS